MLIRNRANKIYLFIIIIVLLASVLFFILGLSYPILQTKKHIIGFTLSSDNVWLSTSIEYFFQAGEYLLGSIILTFTIIFPIIKYFELTNRVFLLFNIGPKTSKFLAYTDKWSMLDVFIVALLILNYKMDSSLVSMEICIGTTFFAISILLRMILSNMKA
ncbi:MAG: paraquat-inducible protein A [Bacteroidales bacterium]|nr:paraquat-inducible protein A [Bacteroidales bacterium]